MNCINKNSKEFKELEEVTGFSPFLLNRIIVNYQSASGVDHFPDLDYILMMGDNKKRHILESIDRYTSDQYNNIENTNVDVLFVRGVSEDMNRSVAFEKLIREELTSIADELKTPIRFIHNRKSIDKLQFVNGEIRVNLYAINESDSLATLKKPLIAALEDSRQHFRKMKSILDIPTNYTDSNIAQKSRVVTEFTVNTEEGMITYSIDDMKDRTIINDGSDNLFLVDDTDEAVVILANDALSPEEKVTQLKAINSLLELVVDDNYNAIVQNSIDNDTYVVKIGNQPYIESTYGDIENRLDLAIKVYDHYNKDIFNIANDENNTELFEILEGMDGTTEQDEKLFKEYDIDAVPEVEVFPFGPIVFKTSIERERYVNRISSLQGVSSSLLDTFRANNYRFEGLKLADRKNIHKILESVGNHAKTNFKRNYSLIGRRTDPDYKKSDLGLIISKIIKKAKNMNVLASKSNVRSLRAISVTPRIENIQRRAEIKEKKNTRGVSYLKTDIVRTIKDLNQLYKIDPNSTLIDPKKEYLEDMLFEYYNDTGERYIFPSKRGIHPDIITLVENLSTETSKRDRVNAPEDYNSYIVPPSVDAKLAVISQNISENQRMILEKYGSEYSGIYGSLRNKKYSINIENREQAQQKIDIISKSLNANIIWDSSLEARAALLSTNSYQAIEARKRGDERPIIVINPEFLSSDTVFHEFGHLYIELLGENDPLIQNAINQLIGTELYDTVKKQYPELSGLNLDKEVLATALGMEADMIFKRNITKLSAWQKIKRAILDAMRAIFNMNNDSLEQLAKEVLGDRKSRVRSGAVYSSNINFYSKYKVDNTKNIQQEAQRLFEELTSNSSMNEETHRYTVDQEEYVTSITSIVKQMRNQKFNSKNKGSREIEFNIDDFSKDIILHKLDAPKLPAALADALDEYVNRRIPGTSSAFEVQLEENWFDVYQREMGNENLSGLSTVELQMLSAIKSNNPQKTIETFKEALLKDYDKIMDRSVQLQKIYNSSSIMGNIVHDAVEKFIKSNQEFPANIQNIEKFRGIVSEIVEKGKREGSIFFSEQILFDTDTKAPGTADLIEITKDGKFKIYDFKTIGSFIDKKSGEGLTDYKLYYMKGYVNQLMSYGEILKKYGIEASEDPYHIIITEVRHTDSSNIAEDLSGEITLGNVRHVSIKNLPNNSSNYKKTQAAVNRYFKTKKVSNINLKSEIENVEDAVDRMYQVVSKFNRSLKAVSQDTNITYSFDALNKLFKDSEDGEAIKKHAEEVNYEYKKYASTNNKLIIGKFIDQIHSVMGDLLNFHNDGEVETSAHYLRSLNYVIQTAESLYDIKKGLTPAELTKSNNFTPEQAEEIETKINETLDAIIKNKEFYRSKLIQNAIYTLATHSNMQEGAMIEKLEMQARKTAKEKGDPLTKDYITRYVQERIRDKKDILENNEMAYWTAQYENGILDLRTLEAMFADPGMISSQIVQVVKQMMDSNDLFVRQQMMEYGPDINTWYEGSSRQKGDTRKQWAKFLTKSKVYIGETNSYELIEDGGIIPEFVSDYYYDKVKLENEKRNLNREKKYLINTQDYNKLTADKIDAINDKLDEIITDFKILQRSKQNSATYKATRVNPDFAKLSVKEQEDLRYIHKNLKDADERIDDLSKRLNISVNGITIYNLPKQRMSMYEAGIGQSARAFTSQIKDFVRPPADEDTENITTEEREVKLAYETGTVVTDLKGNQFLDVPVFYRNELEDARLQSFDIPTLLLENHQSTLAYQQATAIEADLFVIQESISSDNNDKILKTDSFNSRIMKDVGNVFKQKSTDNNLYKALRSSIENRLNKRSYSGVYGKNNYKLIKAVEAFTRFSSINSLTMNFKSMLSTSIQGSIFRTIEGIAGEHFNMNDWKDGTAKAYKDMPAIVADTQKHVHDSKTNLLIKYFGLEQRQSALANKFVQDNVFFKNLDTNALYAVTSIAENTVTSMLMYSMLNNVKVMDENQNYLDKDGKIVKDAKDAMTLDEAYTVEKGKLVLHPKVVYTNRNFIEKYKDGGDINSTVVTEISSRMQNVYANMYGQYNEHLKSMVQRTTWGKMIMSMKGWLPRGIHNRFRGITSAIPFTDNFLSFEDLRDERNMDKRFYSQSSKSFHEGYYATGLRYSIDVIKGMQNNLSMATFSNVYSNMTTHERANLKRALIELAIIVASLLLYNFVAALAKAYDDDDEGSEKFYFIAYMTYRLHDELATFVSPFAMADMVQNPAAAFNTLNSIKKLLFRLIGADYTIDEGFDWSINDRYQKGDKKDQLKVKHDFIKLVPGTNNTLQILNLFGADTGKSMKDQFKGQMMAEQQ